MRAYIMRPGSIGGIQGRLMGPFVAILSSYIITIVILMVHAITDVASLTGE